jgi:hypothetical protein
VFLNLKYRDPIAIFHFGDHASGYELLLESPSGASTAREQSDNPMVE